jgi:hypothetical protein
MKKTLLLLLLALCLWGCGGDPSPYWLQYDGGADGGPDGGGDTDTDTSTSSDTDTGTTTDTTTDTSTDTATDTTTTDTGSETGTGSDTESACPADVAALDSTTGLCWQIVYTAGVTKADAESYCDGLDLGGFTDWRLPSRDEYVGILSGCDSDVLGGGWGYCNNCVASPVCHGLLDSYGDVGCYWMSDYVSPGYAWGVCLDTGYMATGYDTNPAGYVRCVRSTL